MVIENNGPEHPVDKALRIGQLAQEIVDAAIADLNAQPRQMLADAEQKATVGYPFQQIDLGRTDQRGFPVRTNGIGVQALGYGYFSYRYWFADEYSHEAYEVSWAQALEIIADVLAFRADPAGERAKRKAALGARRTVRQ